MNYGELAGQILSKKSFLCVGLDPDIQKIPRHLIRLTDPLFEFCKQIIDATARFTVAYKTNTSFFESIGTPGWTSLELTVKYIRDNYPEIFIIADAKRGDIGNSSELYAKAFFDQIDFDAVTVSAYMGKDSVMPFLAYKNKWVIILSLTSNPGANDFQLIVNEENKYQLYEQIIQTSAGWGSMENTMYVAGATRAEMLTDIRKLIPEHFLLIPGLGAQGGSLTDVANYGFNKQCGILVNSGRSIIYADQTIDFGKVAGSEARKVQQEMYHLLNLHHIL